MPRTDETLLARAREMRVAMTTAEQRLWLELRAKRFSGVKFSRQVVIGPFIVDFAARSRKLVIELDGDTHAAQASYDARRSSYLERLGYRVIRFTNYDIGSNLEGVLTAIGAALGTAPLPNPLPRGERES